MILHGQFNGLDRLPPDWSFADELGVSKHQFREALRLLEQDGLVRVKAGRNGGVFLTTPGTDVLSRTFAGTLARKGTKLRDLMEARQIIEPAAVELACSAATDEEIQSLVALVEAAETAATYDSRRNTEFHLALCAAAHNDTLLLMMRSIQDIIHGIDLSSGSLAGTETLSQDSRRAHRSILRALQRRDAQQAAHRMRLHLVGWGVRLRETGLDPDGCAVRDVLLSAR
jgi:DNA-binding FadR family transcriptional regulator